MVHSNHFSKSSALHYSLFTELFIAELRQRKGTINGLVYWCNSGSEKKIALQTGYVKLRPSLEPR
jgi:hypothetical protein